MTNRTKLPGRIIIVYLLMLVFFCSTGLAGKPLDIQDHWAEKEISQWMDKGLITGYSDESFKPNDSITRAEFMALINRAYGFTKKADIIFSDIDENNWFYDDASKAVAAGYITGYSDVTLRPNNDVSRQEVAVILSRLLKMSQVNNKSAIEKFSDFSSIPAWSKEAVNSVVVKGYIGGYPDGNYRPGNSTTRAETVTILARVVGELYNSSGSYGLAEDKLIIPGNVTINTTDILLENITIEGNLYLTAGIGDGNVILNNVTVKGTTVISGGGENSITLDHCSLNEVIVKREDDKVRIVAQGNTNIQIVRVKSGSTIDTSAITDEANGVVTIFINTDEEVELIGKFGTVIIEGEGANVSLINATVEKMVINAPTTVTGHGKIENAFVNVNGCSFEKKPENLFLADGVAVDIIVDPVEPTVKPDKGGGGGGPSQPPSTISLDRINHQEMFIGQVIDISVSTDATRITATSDNTEVLTVEVVGKKLVLTTKKLGAVRITVTGSKSGYNDRIRTFTVLVKEPTPPGVALSAINATNGTVTVTFNKPPAPPPTVDDFTITKSINGGQAVDVSVTDVLWNQKQIQATLTIPLVAKTSEEQSVVISARYKNTDFISAGYFIVSALPSWTTISNTLEATFEVQEQN
ncbi:MAG: hypothetical protein APF76_03005 [Desulfitibacter sp. BRH_c19]|nr:MAG: hypothetical protein APF76_03005 [Desulfitibacter sp. BRH_c19]